MITTKKEKRTRRHARIRARIHGTAERPRLAVFKSNRYLYAQLIDDKRGVTLASVNSATMKGKTMREAAVEVGREIAKRAGALDIEKVVFDRGGFLYAGKVKAVSEGAREGGLQL